MSKPSSTTDTSSRDGTSQSGRFLRELDPASVWVDERSTRDLLAFARAYARELRYFSAEGAAGETADVASAQDWRGFFAEVDLDQAVAYLRSPESFTAAQAAPYARPHFALFLTFLKLLDQGRGQLNTFTQRHLEFFYRDTLRMTPKPAVPDQVHVLVDLETASYRLALPAGTALLAGKDSLDRTLVYRTSRELVASQVAVAQIRSLHAEISVTGIPGACPANLDDAHRQAGFMEMMRIALGHPNPGDPLPVDPGAKPPLFPGVPPAAAPPPKVGFAEMVAAAALIARVESGLGMPSFDDYRELVRLRRQRRLQDGADWTAINDTLVAAGRVRATAFDIKPRSSSDFNANVTATLGKSIEDLFSELEEVTTMEDAYAALWNRRAEVGATLAQALAPLTLEQFESMMQVKTRIDLEWSRIGALLEAAGRHLNAAFDPAALRAAAGFDAKLAAALPQFSFAGGFDAFHDAFTSVEKYFYMSAEGYRFIMSLATRPAGAVPDDWGWQKVHEIVGAAHREMVYAQRRDALKRVAQDSIANGAPLQALREMLAEILGATLGPTLQADLALKELYPPPATVPVVLAAIVRNPASVPDWDHVVQVLEIAQRNWQNFKDPTPERVEWRNLHPAADATAVPAQPAQPALADAQALPRWKTFGRAELARADDAPPPPVLGWAIGSPLLAMAEGQRSIVLTLGFDADPESFDLGEIRRLFASDNPAGAGRPLQALLSTGKGWLEPDTFKVSWAEPQMAGYPKVQDADTSKLRTLVFSFTLAKGQPALTPLVRAVHGMATDAPVLRLMMRPYWDGTRYSTRYATLRKLRLVRTHLAVTVLGLEHFLLQNDDGVLASTKPFEPFGVVPAVGSRLVLGHPEIVGKALTSLQFNVTWMGVPDKDLGAHYARYELGPNNTSFKVVVALADDGVLRYFSPASAPPPAAAADPGAFASSLFDANDARKPVGIPLRPPSNQGRPDLALTTADDVTEWNRHLVWELTPTDFQHAVYSKTAVKQSLAMAADIANRPAGGGAVDPGKYLVNTPYTPKIKSLSLDYSAATETALAAATGATGAITPAARSFHVHPFGHAELKPVGAQAWCTLLPAYDFEGELCIGLRNVQAPQNVSLLFQVAEGSANPDLVPEPLQWSYLDGNRWLSLHEGGLLGDASRGLINTGIIELSLPAAAPSTLLPDGLYWIRAAIPRASEGVCDIVRIHPNAALAVFDNDSNAPGHLAVPLAPGRIQGPLLPTAGVAGIRQPYTSFGGKTPEQPADFNLRVSERLRHKRRALTIWDYERLVLEKFPQIYKVKCLRADPSAHPHDPGRIVLVVIPDIRNRLPFNPFEPKVPADQIRDIEAFLRDKTPPFASVEVRNAHYVPVKVRCGVRFLPGRDEGYCRQRLMDELNRFLSPWAYDEGADIVIGGSIYANSIINFIDQRDYVDYVAGFKLFTGDDDVFVPEPEEGGYRASTNRPDGVLVAARQHRFDVIPDADYRIEEFTGINYMMVELDFIPA